MIFQLKREEGHSSVTVLVILILISTLVISLTILLRPTLMQSADHRREMDEFTHREERARQVFQALQDDPTPQSQSNEDPVWELIDQWQSQGIDAELEDTSSRLNPNWLRFKLFEKTRLSQLIISGESPDTLHEQRMAQGFSNHLPTLNETYGEENLESYFTLHSWANVNVTHEWALEQLHILRHGESGAYAFRDRIQQGLRQFKLWNRDELPELFSSAEKDLYPAVNTLPLMNVHFIDPFLLECILSYPYREEPLENPQGIAQNLISARDTGEITPETLHSMIGPNEKQMRVLQYLGTQTWFWQYSEIHEDREYYWIFCWDEEQWQILERGEREAAIP